MAQVDEWHVTLDADARASDDIARTVDRSLRAWASALNATLDPEVRIEISQ